MKNLSIYLILILVITIIAVSYSCTSENEEEYFGECELVDEQGDTTDIYYEDMSHIFEGICASCHDETYTYREGILMNSYHNVVSSFGELVPDTYVPKIIRAINHTGPYKMPNGQPKLSECNINKIEIWFEKGMLKKE